MDPLLKQVNPLAAFKAAERVSWGCLRSFAASSAPELPGPHRGAERGDCFGRLPDSPTASRAGASSNGYPESPNR